MKLLDRTSSLEKFGNALQRARVIDRDVHQVTDYASLAQFLGAERVPSGITTIEDGTVPIDLLISPGKNSTTICFFHGAIENDFILPVLSGLGISGGSEANRVFISDPSLVLDDELMLSWYAGNVFQPDLQSKIVQILDKVFASLGSERLVFFGGSGGGFAALYFAQEFPEARAIVFNPQTNIAHYQPRAVRSYVEKAFRLETNNNPNPLASLPSSVVTDVCTLYAKHSESRVIYLQNSNDLFHVESHLLPFLQSRSPELELLVLCQPWAEGHSPPPKSLLTQVLDIASSEANSKQQLLDLGFTEVGQLPNGGIDPSSVEKFLQISTKN